MTKTFDELDAFVLSLRDRIDVLEVAVGEISTLLRGRPHTPSPNYPAPPAPPPGLISQVESLLRFVQPSHPYSRDASSLSTTIFEIVEARIARNREKDEYAEESRSIRGRIRSLLQRGITLTYRHQYRSPKDAHRDDDDVLGPENYSGLGSLGK